ncbi:MAG: RNA polymerase sigma factor [Lachnospiraceae bacterium]|nr:RNA polymerase sigma factor [Lachnospiraceae bacterium]
MEQIRKYFDQIYNETYDKTIAYILTKCGRKDVVEDILQEVYLELLKVLEQKKVHYIKSPEAFVLQLAKSKVYRYYSEQEQQKVCDYVEEPEESATFDTNRNATWEDVLIDQLTAKEVMEYLAERDELTKEIFYQHFFENKTIKEIAKVQGVKEFTVKNRLYRTLKELKGMKRFAIIAGILLLAALLAKPVYTWAEEMVYSIKNYLAEDIADIMLCGAFYKKYKVLVDNGTVSENVCININDVEYSFADLEKIWLENPWLTKINWNADESAEEMEEEGDFYFIEVDSFLEIQQ